MANFLKGDGAGDGKKSFWSHKVWSWVILTGLVVALFFFMNNAGPRGQELRASEFWTRLEDGGIRGPLTINDSRITGWLRPDANGQSPPFWVRYDWKGDHRFVDHLKDAIDASGQYVSYDFNATSDSPTFSVLMNWGPLVLIAALAYFFFFRILRSGGNSITDLRKSKHQLVAPAQAKVRWVDVGGLDGVKAQLADVVAYLKDPKDFGRLGARPAHGILLTGRPGTGKTRLAEAIAGEAGVPLLRVSACDFVELFLGVGAARVHDLFQQARAKAPCVILLDDADVFGFHDVVRADTEERHQAVTAVLAEMDALGDTDALVVIAASNRPDLIDPAMLRAQRFGRRIELPLPDATARRAILGKYLARLKVGPDVNADALAQETEGFTGADLAELVNRAAIAATQAGQDAVNAVDFTEALRQRATMAPPEPK